MEFDKIYMLKIGMKSFCTFDVLLDLGSEKKFNPLLL